MLSNDELWRLRRNDDAKVAECLKVVEAALKAAVPLPTGESARGEKFSRVIKISLSLEDLGLDEKENYTQVQSVLELVIKDLRELEYFASYYKEKKILEIESRE
jgi:hypothetical protein